MGGDSVAIRRLKSGTDSKTCSMKAYSIRPSPQCSLIPAAFVLPQIWLPTSDSIETKETSRNSMAI